MHHCELSSLFCYRSDVIIYAAHERTRLLYIRNETTIIYINKQISGEHKTIALSVKILRAEVRTPCCFIYNLYIQFLLILTQKNSCYSCIGLLKFLSKLDLPL